MLHLHDKVFFLFLKAFSMPQTFPFPYPATSKQTCKSLLLYFPHKKPLECKGNPKHIDIATNDGKRFTFEENKKRKMEERKREKKNFSAPINFTVCVTQIKLFIFLIFRMTKFNVFFLVARRGLTLWKRGDNYSNRFRVEWVGGFYFFKFFSSAHKKLSQIKTFPFARWNKTESNEWRKWVKQGMLCERAVREKRENSRKEKIVICRVW